MTFSFKYFLTLLNTIAVKTSVVLIKVYQRLFSPDKSLIFSPFLKGRVCSHEPHCSEYALRALRRYGFVQGRAKAIDRISRCTATWTKSYDPDHYRVVFFSSAPIGIPFLRELVQDSSMDVVGVVTMPDKPKGRGQKVQPNVIKQEMQILLQKKSLTPIRKILVLHGFATGPDKCRIPWIKKTFTTQGIQVETPKLPNPTQPNLSAQLAFLQQHYAGWVDEDTMIIGHSLGGRLAQHFVSTLSCRIHTLVCIAPSVPTKHYEKLKESDNPIFAQGASYLQGYVQDHPLEKENIKKNVQNHEIWMSEDDPIIPFDAIKTYYDTHFPHATQRIFKDKGHFSTQEKTTSLPELTETIYQYDDMIKTPTKLHPEKSEKGKSFFTWLTKKSPDYLVVIAYGKIIPQAILDVPKILPVNVHGSLLPIFRGASPIQSVFLPNHHLTIDSHILGRNTQRPTSRKTAQSVRVILQDEQNKIALIYDRKLDYRSLVGGKIKKKETRMQALQREVKEESGCDCEVGELIGTNEAWKYYKKEYHFAYCYQAKVIGQKGTPNRTTREIQKKGSEVHRMTPIEAIATLQKLLKKYPNTADSPQPERGRLFLAHRALFFLQEFTKNKSSSTTHSNNIEQKNKKKIETGITIMEMAKKMDTGAMIHSSKFSVPFERTTEDVIEKMKILGPTLLKKTLIGYSQGLFDSTEQHHAQATYCQKIEKSDGEFVLTITPISIVYAKYRAFALWPKIYFMLSNEKRVVVELLELDQKTFFSHQHEPLFSPEQTLHPAVQTITLKPQGKKAMDRESFVNGYLKSKSK